MVFRSTVSPNVDIQGVPPVLNPAQRTNTFVKDRPSKFGRVHVTTSASSLIAVLATRSFVGVVRTLWSACPLGSGISAVVQDNPNLAQPEPIVVIPESKLRALLMKALGCRCQAVVSPFQRYLTYY